MMWPLRLVTRIYCLPLLKSKRQKNKIKIYPGAIINSAQIINMSKKKLVVIGGGAAGFFCAVNAAQMNPLLEVIIIEKTGKLLSKVKISGGGRCNVTHACFSIAEMVKKYPRGAGFLKKAFHEFFTTDTIAWFKKRHVELKTEADGRMFPVSNTSQTVIDCLMNEVNRYDVGILMNRDAKQLTVDNGQWKILFA